MPAPHRLPNPFPFVRTEEHIRSDLREQLSALLTRWAGRLERDRRRRCRPLQHA